MRRGFTMVELVIVLFISSLLWLGTYQLVSLTRRIVSAILETYDTDLTLVRLRRQLVKDIQSVYMPRGTYEYYVKLQRHEEQKTEAGAQQPAEAAEQVGKIAPSKAPEKQEKKPPEKPAVDNIFYLTGSRDGFILSCITTGGIQQLDRTGQIKPVPLTKRVAFVGRPDPDISGALTISYRVSEDLDLAPIIGESFSPTYTLVTGIKSLSFRLKVVKLTAEGTPEEPAQLDAWTEEEIFKEFKTLIPQEITITGELVDPISKRGIEFSFSIALPAYTLFPPPVRDETKIEEAEKAEEPRHAGEILKDIRETFMKVFENGSDKAQEEKPKT